MHPIYDQAAGARNPKGPDYVARIAVFDAALSDVNNGPFSHIEKGLTAALKNQCNRTVEDICSKVMIEFDALKVDFERWKTTKDQGRAQYEHEEMMKKLIKLDVKRQEVLHKLNQLKVQYDV